MSAGFASHITHLPNDIPYEVCPTLTEVFEFKYDDPGDWELILDNLGYCFERGVQPISDLFVGPGEMELFQLHWTMLCKLTNMTRLEPVDMSPEDDMEHDRR
jgi:hypothetical protein